MTSCNSLPTMTAPSWLAGEPRPTLKSISAAHMAPHFMDTFSVRILLCLSHALTPKQTQGS